MENLYFLSVGSPPPPDEDEVLLHSITARTSIISTTLTQLDSFVIADNGLLAGDVVDMFWEGSILQNDAAQTMQLALFYDTVQIMQWTSASLAQNTNRRRWMAHAVMAVRAPNDQYNSWECEVSNVSAVSANAVTGVGSGYALQPTTTDFDAGPKTIELRGRLTSTAVAVEVSIDIARIVRYRT